MDHDLCACFAGRESIDRRRGVGLFSISQGCTGGEPIARERLPAEWAPFFGRVNDRGYWRRMNTRFTSINKPSCLGSARHSHYRPGHWLVSFVCCKSGLLLPGARSSISAESSLVSGRIFYCEPTPAVREKNHRTPAIYGAGLRTKTRRRKRAEQFIPLDSFVILFDARLIAAKRRYDELCRKRLHRARWRRDAELDCSDCL